jgi:hypothetical protein
LKALGLLAPIPKIGIRNADAVPVFRRLAAGKDDDAVRIRKRQPTEQDCIHEGEHGGVGSDPKSQGEHYDEREPALPSEHAASDAKVLQ